MFEQQTVESTPSESMKDQVTVAAPARTVSRRTFAKASAVAGLSLAAGSMAGCNLFYKDNNTDKNPVDPRLVSGSPTIESALKGYFRYPSGKLNFMADFYFSDELFAESSFEFNPSLAHFGLCLAMASFESMLNDAHYEDYVDDEEDAAEAEGGGEGEGGAESELAGGTEGDAESQVTEVVVKATISADYQNGCRNLEAFFDELGAFDFVSNDDYHHKPTPTSIGLGAAHRPIIVTTPDGGTQSYELVILGIRGAGYELEWCSNVTVGSEGNHRGFQSAADAARAFLSEYLAKYGPSFGNRSLKLLVAGFSRAAATTNVLGGTLNELSYAAASDDLRPSARFATSSKSSSPSETVDLSVAAITAAAAEVNGGKGVLLSRALNTNLELFQKDAYFYCFEAPAGHYVTTESAWQAAMYDHANIHSVINPCDIVPKFAPGKLGFMRYGTDVNLPSPANGRDYKRTVHDMEDYLDLIGEESKRLYRIDQFPRQIFFSQQLDAFTTTFINTLVDKCIHTRSNFVEHFQSSFVALMEIVMDLDMRALISAHAPNLVENLLLRIDTPEFRDALEADAEDGICDRVGDILADVTLQESLNEGIDLSAYESIFADLYKNVFNLLGGLILEDPILCVSLFQGFGAVGSAHFPELCLAWMRSIDPNYTIEQTRESIEDIAESAGHADQD